jgi:Relaxase/Mobilisation nuclease domain.
MRKGKNERVSLKEIRGFCSEKITGAMQELDAIGNASACENYVYHASINPALSDHLTPEQMLQAVDILERQLKLENHQRVIVSHEKEGREHYHIACLRKAGKSTSEAALMPFLKPSARPKRAGAKSLDHRRH